MKKKTSLVLLLVVLSVALAGCEIYPTDVNDGRWYFETVTIDETTFEPGQYTLEFQEEYLYDYCVFEFNKDSSIVVSKYYNQEEVIRGTYKYDKKKVTIVLDNGDVFKGVANKYMFDGVWYVFCIENQDIKINLNEGKTHPSSYQRSRDRYYKNYDFSSIDDLKLFFLSEEKKTEIFLSFESSYDDRISHEFRALYRNIVEGDTTLFVPTLDERPWHYSLHIRTVDQYDMPWITYVMFDNYTRYLISTLYLNRELPSNSRKKGLD